MTRRIILIGPALAGILAGVVWHNSAPLKYCANLSGGRTLVLERISYGKTNHYNYGGAFANIARRYLPLRWKSLFPNAGTVIRTTAEDEFSCWVTVHDDKGGYGSLPAIRVELIDEHGCVMGRAAETAKAKLSPYWFHFTSFPRRQKNFLVRVSDLQDVRLAEWLVRNPVPTEFPEWQAERLPSVRTNGTRTFCLNGFDSHPNYPFPYFTPIYSITKNGKPTADSPYDGSLWRDATGNRVFEDNRLCPYDPAWKLTSRFVASTAGTVFQATLPARGAVTPLSGTQIVNGITVDLIAIANAGTITYSNGFPVSAKPNFAGFRGSKRTQTVTNGIEITQITLDNPHLAVRVQGLAHGQFLTVLATGSGERVYDAYRLPGEPGLDFFVLRLPPNTTSATLRFLVQQAYETEFFVKPPVRVEP